jgi:predicted amidohydrolase
MLEGAEMLIVPAAWPMVRVGHWRVLAVARAIENLSTVVAVNRCGVDAGDTLGGGSLAVGPTGTILAECDMDRERLALCNIDPDETRSARQKFPWLRDRRTGMYHN